MLGIRVGLVAAIQAAMRWVLLCALVGCLDSASTSSMCDASPHVQFVRANHSLIVPLAVAVGGTATVQLQCWLADNPGAAPFDLPSVATTDSDPAATVAMSGATLVVSGRHEGTNTVHITSSDGSTTYGSLELHVAAVDHLAFRSTYDVIPPNVDVAFAKQFGSLAEVLLAATSGDLLADDSAQVAPPPGAVLTAIRPGVFDYNATPLGNHVVEVNSGGTMYSTPFVVVD